MAYARRTLSEYFHKIFNINVVILPCDNILFSQFFDKATRNRLGLMNFARTIRHNNLTGRPNSIKSNSSTHIFFDNTIQSPNHTDFGFYFGYADRFFQ